MSPANGKKKWRGRESNPRQRAYESPALATELPRRSTGYIIPESNGFVNELSKIHYISDDPLRKSRLIRRCGSEMSALRSEAKPS